MSPMLVFLATGMLAQSILVAILFLESASQVHSRFLMILETRLAAGMSKSISRYSIIRRLLLADYILAQQLGR